MHYDLQALCQLLLAINVFVFQGVKNSSLVFATPSTTYSTHHPLINDTLPSPNAALDHLATPFYDEDQDDGLAAKNADILLPSATTTGSTSHMTTATATTCTAPGRNIDVLMDICEMTAVKAAQLHAREIVVLVVGLVRPSLVQYVLMKAAMVIMLVILQYLTWCLLAALELQHVNNLKNLTV